MLERGRAKTHKQSSFVDVDLLGFQGDCLPHNPLPARYHGYLVKFALESVRLNQCFEAFLEGNDIAGAGRGGWLFQGAGGSEAKGEITLDSDLQR